MKAKFLNFLYPANLLLISTATGFAMYIQEGLVLYNYLATLTVVLGIAAYFDHNIKNKNSDLKSRIEHLEKLVENLQQEIDLEGKSVR